MESNEEEELVLLLALSVLDREVQTRRRRKRRMWVRPIFTQRRQQGDYHRLLQEMRIFDPDSHFRFMRMSKERFDCLLAQVIQV